MYRNLMLKHFTLALTCSELDTSQIIYEHETLCSLTAETVADKVSSFLPHKIICQHRKQVTPEILPQCDLYCVCRNINQLSG